MGDFVMPSLGADMEAGTVLEWRVQPGDTVHRGDIVAVVDTEKSTIEVEVFEDGVVEELLAAPGDELPVGAPLARIAAAPAAPAPDRRPARAPAGTPRRKHAEAKPARTGTPRRTRPAARRSPAEAARSRAAPRAPRPPGAAPVRASPLARRRAAERHVDLADIAGSGPGGAVVAADLDRAPSDGERAPGTPSEAAEPGTPAAADEEREDRQAAMRHAIGALMARSAREIPHYHLATTIDLSAALTWLTAANERRSVAERLLPGALLLKATARAAIEVPAVNGFWVDDAFQAAPAVHLGVAVALRGGGLIAPALHDADRLTLDELMSALRDLVGRARAGRLRSSEMSDPTLTVTNLGEQGVEEVHGVIYAPQVALVGFGRVTDQPWASQGMLGVRPTVRATLAADHRVSDGLVGARFLNALDHLLQSPEDL
ncbi:MAG: 2-oxo acid dehydrogenase subunit E2 [Acidimicrobiales bacterium]|nr:2-oxo acid dehydrogenase subunit E2 [Acidimicrobiales bacterium]